MRVIRTFKPRRIGRMQEPYLHSHNRKLADHRVEREPALAPLVLPGPLLNHSSPNISSLKQATPRVPSDG